MTNINIFVKRQFFPVLHTISSALHLLDSVEPDLAKNGHELALLLLRKEEKKITCVRNLMKDLHSRTKSVGTV